MANPSRWTPGRLSKSWDDKIERNRRRDAEVNALPRDVRTTDDGAHVATPAADTGRPQRPSEVDLGEERQKQPPRDRVVVVSQAIASGSGEDGDRKGTAALKTQS